MKKYAVLHEPGDIVTLAGTRFVVLDVGMVWGVGGGVGVVAIMMPMQNVPASSVTDSLVTRSDGHLFSLDDEVIEKLVNENGFSAYTIPAGTYEGQTEDIKTVALPFVIFTTEDADEEMIYNLTKSIYENKEYFEGVHSSFAEFDPDTMNEGTAISLHPGAERFYKEIGLM